QKAVLLLPEALEVGANPEDNGHAVLLDEQLEEVEQCLVHAVEHALEAVLLLGAREVRREEEDLQVAVRADRVRELVELLVDQIELVVLACDREQRARVHLGQLLHLGDSSAAARAPRVEGLFGVRAHDEVALEESPEKSSSPSAS